MTSTSPQGLSGIDQQVWLDSIRSSSLRPDGHLERPISSGEIGLISTVNTMPVEAFIDSFESAVAVAAVAGSID